MILKNILIFPGTDSNHRRPGSADHVDGQCPDSPVAERGAALGPHVHRERHHPLQLRAMAPADRPAAAGYQVDQAQVRRQHPDRQTRPEG